MSTAGRVSQPLEPFFALPSVEKPYSCTTYDITAPTLSAMAESKSSKTDVLIIGAGPAGLMLALWLARLGVDARIVDKRTNKVYSGQADG